jgi:hypothetical protein
VAQKNFIAEGYCDAFVMELSRYSVEHKADKEEPEIFYTIQFTASKTVQSDKISKDMGAVYSLKSDDGYYRNSTGNFKTRQEAEIALKKIRDFGFKDAFIGTIPKK